jgi:type IX secretion system PorP/SprF family membrane protein
MRLVQSFVLFLLVLTAGYAQDNLYSLKSGNLNHFNPALVGAQSDAAVSLVYRNQWPTLPSQFITTSLLANYNLKNNLGLGLELSDDRAGEGLSRSLVIKGNVNYAFNKKEVKTRVGLNIGYMESTIDWVRLRFEDQIDPTQGFINPTGEPFSNEPIQNMVLDFGVVSEYKDLVIGISTMQFNQPNVAQFATPGPEGILPLRYVGILGYSKKLGEVNLAGLTSAQIQNQFTSVSTQITSQYKFARLGIGLRQSFGEYGNNDWLLASAGVQFDKFQVSYAYDSYHVEVVSRQNFATHEFSAAWFIKGLKKEDNISAFVNGIL